MVPLYGINCINFNKLIFIVQHISELAFHFSRNTTTKQPQNCATKHKKSNERTQKIFHSYKYRFIYKLQRPTENLKWKTHSSQPPISFRQPGWLIFVVHCNLLKEKIHIWFKKKIQKLRSLDIRVVKFALDSVMNCFNSSNSCGSCSFVCGSNCLVHLLIHLAQVDCAFGCISSRLCFKWTKMAKYISNCVTLFIKKGKSMHHLYCIEYHTSMHWLLCKN